MVLIVLVIAIGLSTRKYPEVFPIWIVKYLGDILWALMVFLGIGLIFNKASTKYVTLGALTFSFLIEFSQLYHAPWIENLRHTGIGGLILGYGFLWSDLICYAAGILIGVLFEFLGGKS